MAARQWMSGALGVIGLAALATGCTDDGVSLHAICPVPPTVEDEICILDPSIDLCVSDGVLNVASANSYRLNLKVESGLKSRMRDVPLLGETNGMQITRAKVELRVPNGDVIDFADDPRTPDDESLDNPYWVSASSYVNPMGRAVVPVTIIGSRYVDWFASRPSLTQIVAGVTVYGETSGKEEVESDEFSWPIRLINRSPLQANNQCIPAVGSCIGSLGQDQFAQACSDVAPAN